MSSPNPHLSLFAPNHPSTIPQPPLPPPAAPPPPAGLGALLVRKDALPCLRRPYFGGGTVAVSLADEPFHSLRPGPAGWEDGTPSFLDFPAVVAGLRFIDRLGGFPAVAGGRCCMGLPAACLT